MRERYVYPGPWFHGDEGQGLVRGTWIENLDPGDHIKPEHYVLLRQTRGLPKNHPNMIHGVSDMVGMRIYRGVQTGDPVSLSDAELEDITGAMTITTTDEVRWVTSTSAGCEPH